MVIEVPPLQGSKTQVMFMRKVKVLPEDQAKLEELQRRFLEFKPKATDVVEVQWALLAVHEAKPDEGKIAKAVRNAVAEGYSWEKVGAQLRLSAEEARRRYGRRLAS